MTPAEIFDHAWFLTKTKNGDGTGDYASMIRLFNIFYLQQVLAYKNTNQDRFGVKKFTDLVASQEKYLLPTECLQIKRAEITFDGTNWKKFSFEDSSQVTDSALDPTSISENYTTADPKVDNFGNYLRVRPIPASNVSGGLILWFFERPSLLISSASLFAQSTFIVTPQDYHEGIAVGIASRIALRKGDEAMATTLMNEWLSTQRKITLDTTPIVLDEQMNMQADDQDFG